MFGAPASQPDLVITPCMRDHLLVVVSLADAWASRTEVELEELRHRTLLTREPGSALHATVGRLLGPTHLDGDNVILLGETEAIKRSVEAGICVVLIHEIAIGHEGGAGKLKSRNL